MSDDEKAERFAKMMMEVGLSPTKPEDLEAAMNQEINPAYWDCVFPESCECRRRGYPQHEHIRCLVPAINATATELGWIPPYAIQS